MNEQQATAIADVLGGATWQSGGGIWLVLLHRPDGKLIVISHDAVGEYDDEDHFNDGKASQFIVLA